MPNHAVRVSLAYDDISGVIATWIDRCQRCVVYEHPKDTQVNKTHVHLAMWGCDVEAEALKRMWKNRPAEAKGNKFWSWKDLDEWNESNLRHLTYLSKGKFCAKTAKNISKELLEKAKDLWVSKSPDQEPAKSKKSDKAKEDLYSIVEEVEKQFDSEHAQHVVYNNLLKCHGCSCGPEGHFRQICYIVMKVLEKRRKRFNSFDFERYVYPVWTKKFEDSKSLFIDGLWKKYSFVNL